MMPYEILMKWGVTGALVFILAFLIRANTEREVKSNLEHKEFVNKIIEQAKEEKTMLINQIDKYNSCLKDNTTQLKQMSDNLRVVPDLVRDVQELKNEIDKL